MRHIGIMQYSVEGAVLCYSTVMHEAMGRLGANRHPLVTMAGLSMAETIPAWDANDLPALREGIAEVVERLARAGADLFVMPDNTAHIALEIEGPPLALPGLNIAEVVTAQAAARGFSKLGILGTRWTMEGPVYPRACAARGLGWAVPDMATRQQLHDIIIDELCLGQFGDSAAAAFVAAVEGLAGQGCDAVALVCTEIPLIVNDANSPLPVIDSTRSLARAALEVALGDAPLPEWRGGPVKDS